MPLVTTLTVNTSNEMNLTIARRFRDIASLTINSVYTVSVEEEDSPEEFYEVNMKRLAVSRFVPFIGRFEKLKVVEVGGTMADDGSVASIPVMNCCIWEEGEGYPDLADRDMMLLLIENISEGYKSGAIRKDTQILGLCCPDAKDRRGQNNVSNCVACEAAVKVYPLECVSRFDSRGSSATQALSGRSFFYDCCLSRSQIDSLIEERPGGKELLLHEDRFHHLLSRGRRYEIPPDDSDDRGEPLHIVEYTDALLEEISRAILSTGVNKKDLSASKVTDAIFRSFTHGSCRKMPSMNKCILASTSLGKLNEIRLPLVMKDLGVDLEDLLRHADQITKATVQYRGTPTDETTAKMTSTKFSLAAWD